MTANRTVSTSRSSTTSTPTLEVKPDLNRKVEPHIPLPDLVGMGYYFLGKDWLETAKEWKEGNIKTPPVMITVANLTHTAARVQYAFEHKRIRIEELCDPDKILHIDSKVLDEAEAQEEPADVLVEAAAVDEEDEEGQRGNGGRKRHRRRKRSSPRRSAPSCCARQWTRSDAKANPVSRFRT